MVYICSRFGEGTRVSELSISFFISIVQNNGFSMTFPSGAQCSPFTGSPPAPTLALSSLLSLVLFLFPNSLISTFLHFCVCGDYTRKGNIKGHEAMGGGSACSAQFHVTCRITCRYSLPLQSVLWVRLCCSHTHYDPNQFREGRT